MIAHRQVISWSPLPRVKRLMNLRHQRPIARRELVLTVSYCGNWIPLSLLLPRVSSLLKNFLQAGFFG
jgi:hypothetical protein